MLPDWYLRLSATSGAAFVPGWSNADVVAVALVAFAVFFVLAAMSSAEWPSDIAFLALVVGGLLVVWPAMLVLTMAAIVLVMIVSFLHSALAPERTARINAEAERRVAPALDQFAHDAGMKEGDYQRPVAGSESEKRRQ